MTVAERGMRKRGGLVDEVQPRSDATLLAVNGPLLSSLALPFAFWLIRYRMENNSDSLSRLSILADSCRGLGRFDCPLLRGLD